MIFCWDHGVPVLGVARPVNWREKALPTYKATRSRDPELQKKVFTQLGDLYRAIQCLGYTQFSVMGLEADDSIGLLAKHFSRNNEVFIFSTDQDYYQLLDEKSIHVLIPRKEKAKFTKLYQSQVEQRFGFSVKRWAEYLALGGDKSDNIKPAPGMGPKTAEKYILNGVDLSLREFSLQSPEFRSNHSKLESIWSNVMKCYDAAQIPTHINDHRIQSCLKEAGVNAYTIASLNPDQTWLSTNHIAQCQSEFRKFLADREMVSLFSLQPHLFDPKCAEQTPPKKKQQRKLF